VKKYLLDTNICIFFLKDNPNVVKKVLKVGFENCYVSEISVAELKFGAENSNEPFENHKILQNFLQKIYIAPIIDSLDIYAKEKVKLRKIGMMIDEFDLLIGSTSIAFNYVMVTNNVSEFKRLEKINIEDWT
jgi:tRNA(fMet)-specific endonuclease VapC